MNQLCNFFLTALSILFWNASSLIDFRTCYERSWNVDYSHLRWRATNFLSFLLTHVFINSLSCLFVCFSGKILQLKFHTLPSQLASWNFQDSSVMQYSVTLVWLSRPTFSVLPRLILFLNEKRCLNILKYSQVSNFAKQIQKPNESYSLKSGLVAGFFNFYICSVFLTSLGWSRAEGNKSFVFRIWILIFFSS